MKLFVHIALLFSLPATAFCQLAAEQKCREKGDTQRSPCGYFMCLVEEGAYRSAYGLISQGVVSPCNEPIMRLSKSKVLASNGAFEEASLLIDELLLEFPEDRRFLVEAERQAFLRILAERPPAVEVIPYNKNGHTPQMLAWIDREEPVILVKHGRVKSHFPRKASEEGGYHFDSEAPVVHDGPSAAAIKAIEKQGFAHVGPGMQYSDSIIFFTATDQRPYGKRGAPDYLALYSHRMSAPLKRPKHVDMQLQNTDVAFPSLSSDGKTMIFSSSMGNDDGTMDLYQSIFQNGEWGVPVSLGERINTTHNELYPELAGDTLFFSSDREDMGYGGMDIYGYSFAKDSIWNLGYPINTFYNDFRIAFSNSYTAYMVSDRPGVQEGDKVLKLQYEDPKIYFKGTIAKAQWPEDAIGKKVTLTNMETGARLVSTIAESGEVSFKNVKGDANYELAVEGIDLPEGFELSLFDQDGELLNEMRSNVDGKFIFVLLTPYDYQLERYDNRDESILSVDILGRVGAEEVPAEGFRIILLDSSGATIGNTYTSDSGEFAFRSVSPNDTYIIKSEVSDTNSAIHILDDKGEVIRTIRPDENQQYVYVRLGASDKIITLTNELKQKVKISDQEQFEIGSVYFDLNAAALTDQAERSLARLLTILKDNPHVNVEMSGHTDSRGTPAYNERLSQKRIEAVLQFLITAGIDSRRIMGRGYGESRLKNHCADGVPCTEEQHAENRRTEFRLYQSESNQ